MSNSYRTRGLLRLIFWSCVLGLTLGVPALAQRQPDSATPPSLTWKGPQGGQLQDYVGARTCGECHRIEDEEFFKTLHARVSQVSPPARARGESSAVAAGRKIYDKMMCAGCHAIGGKGGTVGPKLDDAGVRFAREKMKDIMLKGRPGSVMPMLPADMPTSQINRLLDYLMSLKGQAPATTQTAAIALIVTGCEMCHGPAKKHVEAEEEAGDDRDKQLAGGKYIFNFNGNPKENSGRCLACHSTGKTQDSFGHSLHLAAGVACQDCHSPHLVNISEHPPDSQQKKPTPVSEMVEKRAEAAERLRKADQISAQSEYFLVPKLPEEERWLHSNLLREPQPVICFQCHQTLQGQFALPEHHKVPESFMKCTDCHDPHGNMNRSQLTKTNWETCVNCHTEKRGPFVFEHAAVRVQGCVACHTPHGSVNNFMLKRREQRLLCLQCHTGFHNQAGVPHSRGGYQASGTCTRCHVAVHGSNLDTTLLR